MGLIFVTQFIMTWEFMIEIQSWHINKLVHTDNYYYLLLLSTTATWGEDVLLFFGFFQEIYT